jgi:hypothetical protein
MFFLYNLLKFVSRTRTNEYSNKVKKKEVGNIINVKHFKIYIYLIFIINMLFCVVVVFTYKHIYFLNEKV